MIIVNTKFFYIIFKITDKTYIQLYVSIKTNDIFTQLFMHFLTYLIQISKLKLSNNIFLLID